MQIDNHFDLTFLHSVIDLIFYEINFWIIFLIRSFPPSVKISADQRTPIVAMHYAIRVHHRKYFKHKILPQSLSFFVVRCQKLYEIVHYPA